MLRAIFKLLLTNLTSSCIYLWTIQLFIFSDLDSWDRNCPWVRKPGIYFTFSYGRNHSPGFLTLIIKLCCPEGKTMQKEWESKIPDFILPSETALGVVFYTQYWSLMQNLECAQKCLLCQCLSEVLCGRSGCGVLFHHGFFTLIFVVFCFQTESHYTAMVGLELYIV